jgi:transposase
LLADHGHTVIRLPPHHPDLIASEKIWGIVKTKISAKNVTFKLRDVQQLAEQMTESTALMIKMIYKELVQS